MRHPGLELTDWTLMHPRLSQDAKLVLGATLATPARDARQRQLAAWLPMGRDRVQAAQDELEAAGVIKYRRPQARLAADDPRYAEAKSITSIHPKAETRRGTGKAPSRVFLPGWICEMVPRGRGVNGKLALLVLMLYVREQAMASRIALSDHVVGAMLRDETPKRAVATTRKKLVEAGIGRNIGKQGQAPVLRLVQLDVGTDQNYDKTKRPLTRFWKRANVVVIATDAQWAYLMGRTLALPDSAVERVVELAAEWDGGVLSGQPHLAGTLLDATRDVLSDTALVADSYANRGQGITPIGASSALLTQTSSSNRLHDNQRDPTLTSEDKVVLDRWLEERSNHVDVERPQKHLLPMVKGGFLWMTATKAERVFAMLDAIEARHSADHRLDMERLVVEEKFDANQLLRTMERRYHYLVPRTAPATAEQEKNREKVHALLEGLSGHDDEEPVEVWD